MLKELTRGPHLSFSHPLFSMCRTVGGMEAEVSRSSPPLCVAVVEGDPVFPAVGRRQVDHAPLPELATCLTSVYASPSSSSPSSVRHERRLKLFALAGPIRELLSIDSKSTSPEAPPPL